MFSHLSDQIYSLAKVPPPPTDKRQAEDVGYKDQRVLFSFSRKKKTETEQACKSSEETVSWR